MYTDFVHTCLNCKIAFQHRERVTAQKVTTGVNFLLCHAQILWSSLISHIWDTETMLFFSINAKFALTTRSMTSYNLSLWVGWKLPGCVWIFSVFIIMPAILLLDFSAASLRFGHIPVHKIVEAFPGV